MRDGSKTKSPGVKSRFEMLIEKSTLNFLPQVLG